MVKLLKKKQEGAGDVVITTLVCAFLLLIAFLIVFQPIQKLSCWCQIEVIQRGALLRCEAEGGLTDDIKQLILSSAADAGLDTTQVTISCNHNVDPSDPARNTTFGTKITLKVSYNFPSSTLVMHGFTLENQPQVEVISVSSSTTAKN